MSRFLLLLASMQKEEKKHNFFLANEHTEFNDQRYCYRNIDDDGLCCCR